VAGTTGRNSNDLSTLGSRRLEGLWRFDTIDCQASVGSRRLGLYYRFQRSMSVVGTERSDDACTSQLLPIRFDLIPTMTTASRREETT